MFDDFYDEKYPSPRYTPSTRSSKLSYSTTSSTLSLALTSYPEKYDESNPPPYTYIFYNTIDDKPLPPLPSSSTTKQVRERIEEKPLPPLPTQAGKRQEGEYAWWTRSDEEYERSAKLKEIGCGGFIGKFREEF